MMDKKENERDHNEGCEITGDIERERDINDSDIKRERTEYERGSTTHI